MLLDQCLTHLKKIVVRGICGENFFFVKIATFDGVVSPTEKEIPQTDLPKLVAPYGGHVYTIVGPYDSGNMLTQSI